ncbi:hypothetical protein OG500_23105 [Kitasatospora sp. NBC_01250]|uniref:SAV_915 family protein n=1 Tax=unclassified Kitasatospora TaxID=2633591 RepID=UPI002E12C09E|nr:MULTISPECIES: SAV_915 family protein [unclassified Kitasatospora]WSJ68967.1 hypothetical protein OG294_24210 [Kitasatospora sp. NBC_01302]
MSIPDPEQPVRSVAPPAYVGDWLPELVYAPARPIIREGRRELLYEVRRYPDGRQVLPVFSTLELLVAALGPAQPWAQAPLRAVRAVMAAAGVTEVELDPVVAEGAWRWNEADLARYQGGMR